MFPDQRLGAQGLSLRRDNGEGVLLVRIDIGGIPIIIHCQRRGMKSIADGGPNPKKMAEIIAARQPCREGIAASE